MKFSLKFKNRDGNIETEINAKCLKSVPYDILIEMVFLCTLDELIKSEAIDNDLIVGLTKLLCASNVEERHNFISQTFCEIKESGFLDEFFKEKIEENDDD